MHNVEHTVETEKTGVEIILKKGLYLTLGGFCCGKHQERLTNPEFNQIKIVRKVLYPQTFFIN